MLQQAVLATEDQDYYEHGGVDPVGIGRALYHDLRGTGATQGGSTITQQYVKNVYLTSERSIVRKVKEAVLAVKLERELDKDEILERYLNTIYFGRGAYGVERRRRARTTARTSRTSGSSEASYLAGLIRSPGGADALENPEEATRRRRTVLAAMAREGYITDEERDAVDATPIETGVVAEHGPAGPRPGRGQHPRRQHRHQVLRRGGAPADRRAVRRGRPLRRRAADLHHASTSTCSAPRGTR